LETVLELTCCSGDLEDEHVKKQYEKAYGILLNFFHENM